MAQDIQTNVVLTADNAQYDTAMMQSAASTENLGKSVDSLGTKIDKLTKSAGRKLIGVSAADTAALAGTTLAYGAFEKQMTALNARAAILNTTMSGQKKAMAGYAEQVNELRESFGATTQEAADLTMTITRLSGLPAAGVNQLAKTFSTMGQATQESSSALAQSVLQLQKTMGTTPGKETERYANQLTVLSQATGTSATGLAEFAQQIAPVARQVGTTQTEVQGLAAAFSKAGQDGYQASNFYIRMMNDISYAAQSGSPRLNEFADLAGVLPEKFKGMTGMEQFNSILEGLNKQGPRAVNTLNMLGYEGQRMSKIALTLSQQGGIMGMVGQAKAADRDPGAMARGSKQAMDGLFDSMNKLRIAVTQMAEAFGKFWAGPASKFFDVLAGGAKALRDLAASPLGQLASAISGLAAPFIAFAGAILLAAKAITAFALARQLMTGAVSAGFKETAALTPSARAAMVEQGLVPGVGKGRMSVGQQGANIGQDPTWTRRLMYNAGADLARVTGYQSGQAGSFARTTGGLAAYGAGKVLQYGVAPQFAAASVGVPVGFTRAADGSIVPKYMAGTGGYDDVTRRSPIFTSNTMRGSFGLGPEGPLTRAGQSIKMGWEGAAAAGGVPAAGVTPAMAGAYKPMGFFERMTAAYQGARGVQPVAAPIPATGGVTPSGLIVPPPGKPGVPTDDAGKGFTTTDKRRVTVDDDAVKATKNETTAKDANTKSAAEATKATDRFAKTVSASEKGVGTLGKAVAQTAVAMGTAGAGMAKFGAGIGGQAMGLVGGNYLLAGGIAAFGAYKAYQASTADTDLEGTDRTGFARPYMEASGLTELPMAPGALSTAAEDATQTGIQSLQDAYQISAEEDIKARADTYELVNTSLKDYSAKEAEAALASQWGYTGKTPEFVDQAAMDLVSRFGRGEAQDILGRLQSETAQSPFYLAREAARPGRSGFMDTITNQQSGSGAQEKLDKLYGIIDDTASYIADTQGAAKAQEYQLESYNSAITEFNKGIAEGGFGSGGTGETQEVFAEQLLKQLGVSEDVSDKEAAGLLKGGTLDEFLKTAVFGAKGTPTGTHGATVGAFGPILEGQSLKDMLSAAGVEDTSLTGDEAYEALLVAQTGMDSEGLQKRNDAFAKIERQSMGIFGVGGMLALPSVKEALVTNIGDENAQYKAVQDIVQQLASTERSPAGQVKKLLQLQATGGGVTGLGANLTAGAIAQIQQSQALQAPYQSRTQNFAQATEMFQTIQEAPLAGPKGAEIKRENALAYAQKVQDEYQYFKGLLYQQREYNVMRDRAEDAFNLSRQYAQQDYHTQRMRSEEEYQIARGRAIADFNRSMSRAQSDYDLQRKRAEEDHAHQVQLMIEQQASAYSNMYQRVGVQRTESTVWMTSNLEDQTRRITEQTENLQQARKMGLTTQAIQQAGFGKVENAQQLARFIGEAQNDPSVVKELNKAVRQNVKAAGGLFTDESNKDWKEFQRQYRLGMSRGEQDFNRAMKRSRNDFNRQLDQQQDDYQRMMDNQQEDYEKMMGRQVKAYNLQMEQAAEDLARSAKTIDGSFEEILTKATRRLPAHARKQAEAVLTEFSTTKEDIRGVSNATMMMIADIFGFDWKPPASAKAPKPGQEGFIGPVESHHGRDTSGGPQAADGAVVPGWTPGRDTQTAQVSGGEAIMRPEWTRAVGEEQIDRWNHDAKYGGYGYAGGGVYKPINAKTSGNIHDSDTGYAAVDFSAKVGTPIYAVASGKISRSYDIAGPLASDSYHDADYGPYGSYGRVMYLKTNMGPEVLYAHLSKRGYGQGTKVSGGDPIGTSGSTGNSSGPHLHFGSSDGDPMEWVTGKTGAGTITGGQPYSVGYTAATIPSLDSIIKDEYPSIEDKMAKWVGIHLPRGTMSEVINSYARKKYRESKKKYPGNAAGGVPAAPQNVSGNQELVRKAMQDMGWHQWNALYQLVMAESGFDNKAQNPTSTAYGMFQFLDGTWAGTNIQKTSDPWKQAVAGMRYIKNRYGDPRSAWNFWENNNWYEDGSVFTGPQTIGVGENGPEAVIPLNARGGEFLSDAMRKYTADGRGVGLGSTAVGGSVSVYNYRVDRSTTFSGAITVMANDPNEMLDKLRSRQRLQALARPALTGSRL